MRDAAKEKAELTEAVSVWSSFDEMGSTVVEYEKFLGGMCGITRVF